MAKRRSLIKISESPPQKIHSSGLSKRGKKTIWLGVAAALAGFGILSFTNSAGNNWASILAPFLLIGGYALIAIGIVLKDSPPTSSSPASQ